jgi:hypothetical protein
MPQIKEYRQQVGSSGPVQIRQAQSASDGMGEQALGSALTNIGDLVQKRQEQAEVSSLNAQMAQAHADFTTNLKETLRTADPNDKELSTNFLKNYDDYMAKVSDKIETRQGQLHFNETSAKLKSHFIEAATAGQAELAGLKAVQDYKKAMYGFSNVLQNDPSSFNIAKDMHMKGLEAQVNSGSLPREKALVLQTEGERELSQAAVRGWIKLDPIGAKKQLDEGRWDDAGFSGDVKHSLYKEAEVAIHGMDAEARRIEAEKRRQLEEEQKKTQNEFLAMMQENKLSVKNILESNLDAFGSGSKDVFIRMLMAGEGSPKTDPVVFSRLFSQIHAEDDDPDKIRDENVLNQYLVKGQLRIEDLQKLRQEISGRKTEQGRINADLRQGVIRQAQLEILKTNDLTKLSDPKAAQLYQSWLNGFLSEESDALKKGTKGIYDPQNSEYLGKRIKNYTRDMNTIIKDKIKTLKPNAEPIKEEEKRKEGETIEAYVKRMKETKSKK